MSGNIANHSPSFHQPVRHSRGDVGSLITSHGRSGPGALFCALGGKSVSPLPATQRSSVQEKDRDCGNNAQRDEDEQRDPHADREAIGKRGLTRWDSHEPREPFVELDSMPLFRIRHTLTILEGKLAGAFPSFRVFSKLPSSIPTTSSQQPVMELN